MTVLTNQLWITAQECLSLKSMPSTIQGVHKKAKKENWEFRKKEGIQGGAIEFSINSLPIIARAEYLKRCGHIVVNNRVYDIPKRLKSDRYSPELLWSYWSKATTKQQEKAKAKCEAVIAAEALIHSSVDVLSAFNAVSQSHDTSAANVSRWYYQTRAYDKADYLPTLLGKHGRDLETRKKKQAEITPEAWDFLLADYLRPEKPSFRMCYARLTQASNTYNWTIPSIKTLERKLARDIPVTQQVLLREGEHAVMRLYPAQQRSVIDLDAMEWINGDGYTHNVFVKWFDGQIIRPKTWVWQDIRTRKILAYRTDVSENSDVVRLSLSDLIHQYGIPRHITIDNTRAAANKWLTGGVHHRQRFKIKDDDPTGLIPLLGIELHWTSIQFGQGHGQAKPVERAFSHGGLVEVVDKHPALAGAYTGKNPMDKPDNYDAKNAVDVELFLSKLEEGINFWNSLEKRNTEICLGNLSFDQAFEQSYQISKIRKATQEQLTLLMLPTESITVKSDGTFSLEVGKSSYGKNRYFSESLIGRKGKIVARFDPQNLHSPVLVYTLDGCFICDALCLYKTGYGDQQTGRAHHRDRKDFVKHTKKAAEAQRRMTIRDVAEMMPETQPPSPPETKVVEMFQPYGNTVRKTRVVVDADAGFDADTAFNSAVAALYEQHQKNRI